MFRKWKGDLAKISRLEAAADEFVQSLDGAQLSRAWDFWRLQTELCGMEKMVRARVDARLKDDALQMWKQKMLVNEAHFRKSR